MRIDSGRWGIVWAAAVLHGCAGPAAVKPAPEFVPAELRAAATAPATLAVPARPKATGTPEDARRHIVRGAAAIEIARSNDDLAEAADEFRKATEIAPGMGVAWFNLGAVQSKLGDVEGAIASYRQYLQVSPGAEDADRVSDEIIKLEYRREKRAVEQSAAGTWIESDGTAYTMTVDGEQLVLKTATRDIDPDVDEWFGPGLGAFLYPTVGRNETLTFRLTGRGGKLAGTWDRAETTIDACTVPAETGDVSGEIDGTGHRLTLEFTKARYKVFFSSPLLNLSGSNTCNETSVIEKLPRKFVFLGPLPAGRPGADVTTAHGLNSIRSWVGELTVSAVQNNSPAQQAGLQVRDRILAIDGVAVDTLSAGDAIFRLYGPVGSQVQLKVLHHKEKEPVTLQLIRR